jgi:TFIIF-interacting CTD phosphatase-like protein
VLDLDETLVHATTKPTLKYDIIVEVVIEGVRCRFYVQKRPHVDLFLRTVRLQLSSISDSQPTRSVNGLM